MIKDLKFAESEFEGNDIASLPNSPGTMGYTAEQIKARFDQVGKTMVALGKFNDLIDALTAKSGAAGIGAATVPGISGDNVQTILQSLKNYIDTQTVESGSVTSVCGKAGAVELNTSDISPVSVSATLSVSGWVDLVQSVSAQVGEQSVVLVSPSPQSILEWSKCGIYCDDQSEGTLVFKAQRKPGAEIGVNILIVGR